MIHSVRAVAVTAVVWLAVVGGTVSAEAAPKDHDTRAPAAKQAQSHQTDKKQDQPKTQQSDKKQDGAKSAQSDNHKKADDKKADDNKSKQSDKRQDDTKAGSYSQNKVESAKTDAGGQPKASPKYVQSAAPKQEYAAKSESASKTSNVQPIKADDTKGKGGESKTLAQSNDNKTVGKSRSNPDGGGVDKPYPAAGKDAKSQGKSDYDGNNGCGNDADRADDNNGNCGKSHDKPKKAETSDKNDISVKSYDKSDKAYYKSDKDDKPHYKSDKDDTSYDKPKYDDSKKPDYSNDYNNCVEVNGKKTTRDDYYKPPTSGHPKDDYKPHDKPVPTEKPHDNPHDKPVPTSPTDSSISSVPTPVPTATPTAVKPVTNQPPSAVVAFVETIPQGGVGSDTQVTAPSTFRGPGILVNNQPSSSIPLSAPAPVVSPAHVESVAEVIGPPHVAAVSAESQRSVVESAAMTVMPATGGAPLAPLAAGLAALGGLGLALRRFGRRSS